MSITSTARKATTLFISFAVFNNVCTIEHVAGIAVFITALATKSMRRRKKHTRKNRVMKSSSHESSTSPILVGSPKRKTVLNESKSGVHIV